MIPVLFSVQSVDAKDSTSVTKRGIMFANTYTEAAQKLEAENDVIVDMYLTSVEDDIIRLSEETYNRILEGGIA